MDAEIVLRACWRHRMRLFACAMAGALLLLVGGQVLLSKKYTSSTDVSVVGAFPPSTVDASANQVYVQQPDRFVATQIEILSSRAAARDVAQSLHIPIDTVARAITVSQLEKSDVIRVSATSANPEVSALIADRMATNYLRNLRAQTKAQYLEALRSLQDQQKAVEKAIAALPPGAATNGSASSGNSALNSLVLQQGQLAIELQQLQIASQVAPNAARVVSRAEADPQPVGPGKKTLAMYGFVLGLAIGLCWIALTTGSGSSIETLEVHDTVAGVPMLGVLHRTQPRFNVRHRDLADIGALGVSGELAHLIRLKGPLSVLVMGSPRTTAAIERTLTAPVQAILARQLEPRGADAIDPDIEVVAPSLTVRSLRNHLDHGELDPVAVVVVDADAIRPADLDSVLAGLRTSGTDVLGIVGVR